MRFSNNKDVNNRVIEAITAISNFAIKYLPEDYVLMIELWKAPKSKTEISTEERIRLLIGNIDSRLIRPDFKIIQTVDQLNAEFNSVFSQFKINWPPKFHLISRDLDYRIDFEVSDDGAKITVNSGSIIWGKGSGRPLAFCEIDSRGSYELYYFELEEVTQHPRNPNSQKFEGNFNDFIRFLYELENSSPYPYEVMKANYRPHYQSLIRRSIEEIINML